MAKTFLFLITLISLQSWAQDRLTFLNEEYEELETVLYPATKNDALIYLPRVKKLLITINREKKLAKSKLNINVNLCKDNFSWFDRHLNPFTTEADKCLENGIGTKTSYHQNLEELFKKTDALFDRARFLSGLSGDPSLCESDDCKAYVTGHARKCASSDCKAYVTGDMKYCESRDCLAYIKGNMNYCKSRDCWAFIKGEVRLCTNRDCIAFLKGEAQSCQSKDCQAYLKGDANYCESQDCKAYLSYSDIPKLVRVPASQRGFRATKIPIEVLFILNR